MGQTQASTPSPTPLSLPKTINNLLGVRTARQIVHRNRMLGGVFESLTERLVLLTMTSLA